MPPKSPPPVGINWNSAFIDNIRSKLYGSAGELYQQHGANPNITFLTIGKSPRQVTPFTYLALIALHANTSTRDQNKIIKLMKVLSATEGNTINQSTDARLLQCFNDSKNDNLKNAFYPYKIIVEMRNKKSSTGANRLGMALIQETDFDNMSTNSPPPNFLPLPDPEKLAQKQRESLLGLRDSSSPSEKLLDNFNEVIKGTTGAQLAPILNEAGVDGLTFLEWAVEHRKYKLASRVLQIDGVVTRVENAADVVESNRVVSVGVSNDQLVEDELAKYYPLIAHRLVQNMISDIETYEVPRKKPQTGLAAIFQKKVKVKNEPVEKTKLASHQDPQCEAFEFLKTLANPNRAGSKGDLEQALDSKGKTILNVAAEYAEKKNDSQFLQSFLDIPGIEQVGVEAIKAAQATIELSSFLTRGNTKVLTISTEQKKKNMQWESLQMMSEAAVVAEGSTVASKEVRALTVETLASETAPTSQYSELENQFNQYILLSASGQYVEVAADEVVGVPGYPDVGSVVVAPNIFGYYVDVDGATSEDAVLLENILQANVDSYAQAELREKSVVLSGLLTNKTPEQQLILVVKIHKKANKSPMKDAIEMIASKDLSIQKAGTELMEVIMKNFLLEQKSGIEKGGEAGPTEKLQAIEACEKTYNSIASNQEYLIIDGSKTILGATNTDSWPEKLGELVQQYIKHKGPPSTILYNVLGDRTVKRKKEIITKIIKDTKGRTPLHDAVLYTSEALAVDTETEQVLNILNKVFSDKPQYLINIINAANENYPTAFDLAVQCNKYGKATKLFMAGAEAEKADRPRAVQRIVEAEITRRKNLDIVDKATNQRFSLVGKTMKRISVFFSAPIGIDALPEEGAEKMAKLLTVITNLDWNDNPNIVPIKKDGAESILVIAARDAVEREDPVILQKLLTVPNIELDGLDAISAAQNIFRSKLNELLKTRSKELVEKWSKVDEALSNATIAAKKAAVALENVPIIVVGGASLKELDVAVPLREVRGRLLRGGTNYNYKGGTEYISVVGDATSDGDKSPQQQDLVSPSAHTETEYLETFPTIEAVVGQGEVSPVPSKGFRGREKKWRTSPNSPILGSQTLQTSQQKGYRELAKIYVKAIADKKRPSLSLDEALIGKGSEERSEIIAAIKASSATGRTPLHDAVLNNSTNDANEEESLVIRILTNAFNGLFDPKKALANTINDVDQEGRTAFDLAVQCNQYQKAIRLFRQGAKAEEEGLTPAIERIIQAEITRRNDLSKVKNWRGRPVGINAIPEDGAFGMAQLISAITSGVGSNVVPIKKDGAESILVIAARDAVERVDPIILQQLLTVKGIETHGLDAIREAQLIFLESYPNELLKTKSKKLAKKWSEVGEAFSKATIAAEALENDGQLLLETAKPPSTPMSRMIIVASAESSKIKLATPFLAPTPSKEKRVTFVEQSASGSIFSDPSTPKTYAKVGFNTASPSWRLSRNKVGHSAKAPTSVWAATPNALMPADPVNPRRVAVGGANANATTDESLISHQLQAPQRSAVNGRWRFGSSNKVGIGDHTKVAGHVQAFLPTPQAFEPRGNEMLLTKIDVLGASEELLPVDNSAINNEAVSVSKAVPISMAKPRFIMVGDKNKTILEIATTNAIINDDPIILQGLLDIPEISQFSSTEIEEAQQQLKIGKKRNWLFGGWAKVSAKLKTAMANTQAERDAQEFYQEVVALAANNDDSANSNYILRLLNDKFSKDTTSLLEDRSVVAAQIINRSKSKKGVPLLCHLAREGRIDMVIELIGKGGDATVVDPTTKESLLDIAVKKGNTDMVQKVLDGFRSGKAELKALNALRIAMSCFETVTLAKDSTEQALQKIDNAVNIINKITTKFTPGISNLTTISKKGKSALLLAQKINFVKCSTDEMFDKARGLECIGGFKEMKDVFVDAFAARHIIKNKAEEKEAAVTTITALNVVPKIATVEKLIPAKISGTPRMEEGVPPITVVEEKSDASAIKPIKESMVPEAADDDAAAAYKAPTVVEKVDKPAPAKNPVSLDQALTAAAKIIMPNSIPTADELAKRYSTPLAEANKNMDNYFKQNPALKNEAAQIIGAENATLKAYGSACMKVKDFQLSPPMLKIEQPKYFSSFSLPEKTALIAMHMAISHETKTDFKDNQELLKEKFTEAMTCLIEGTKLDDSINWIANYNKILVKSEVGEQDGQKTIDTFLSKNRPGTNTMKSEAAALLEKMKNKIAS